MGNSSRKRRALRPRAIQDDRVQLISGLATLPDFARPAPIVRAPSRLIDDGATARANSATPIGQTLRVAPADRSSEGDLAPYRTETRDVSAAQLRRSESVTGALAATSVLTAALSRSDGPLGTSDSASAARPPQSAGPSATGGQGSGPGQAGNTGPSSGGTIAPISTYGTGSGFAPSAAGAGDGTPSLGIRPATGPAWDTAGKGGPAPMMASDPDTGAGAGLPPTGSGTAPNISNSSFPLANQGILGNTHYYNVGTQDSQVPVGATANFTVVPPAGKAIATVSWKGGSAFWKYFSTPYTAQAPASMSIQSPPKSNTPTFQFIVDATPGNYVVAANLTYTAATGGGAGQCIITFTSVLPTKAVLNVSQNGQPVVEGNADNPQIPVGQEGLLMDPGIHIQANTTVGSFPGSFMFMQVLQTTAKQVTNSTGGVFHLRNDTDPINGTLIDDGNPTGYNITVNAPNKSGWDLNNPGDSLPQKGQPPPEMIDTTLLREPNDYQQMSNTESFKTYLMYKPSDTTWQGVWIALSEVDWSWSASATNTGGVWKLTASTAPNPPAPTAPSGGKEFPGWVNSTLAENDEWYVGPLP